MVEIHGDQRPTILVLSIVFPILAILAVLLRFEARRLKRVSLAADDWTILAALIVTLGVTYDILLDSRLGRLGWHTKFTPDGAPVFDSAFTAFGKTTYVLEILIWPAVGFNKISVLLFYKRIFVSRPFQIVVWCFIGLSIAWTVTFEFALMFSCMPIASNWNPALKSKCVNQIALFQAALATDVITDGMILLLPIYEVYKLQMRIRQKLTVIAIFLLGGFTTITGIIRLHFLTYAFASLKDPLFNDLTYHYAPPFYWSIIETNTGVICACLPTLRPLLEAYHPSSLLSKFSKTFSSFTSFGSSGSRSKIRSETDIRMGSLSNYQKEALGMRRNEAYAAYDAESGEGDQVEISPKGILYKQRYDVRSQAEEM